MDPKLRRKMLENLYRSFEAIVLKERHLGSYAMLSEDDLALFTDEDLIALTADVKELVRSPVSK